MGRYNDIWANEVETYDSRKHSLEEKRPSKRSLTERVSIFYQPSTDELGVFWARDSVWGDLMDIGDKFKLGELSLVDLKSWVYIGDL